MERFGVGGDWRARSCNSQSWMWQGVNEDGSGVRCKEESKAVDALNIEVGCPWWRDDDLGKGKIKELLMNREKLLERVDLVDRDRKNFLSMRTNKPCCLCRFCIFPNCWTNESSSVFQSDQPQPSLVYFLHNQSSCDASTPATDGVNKPETTMPRECLKGCVCLLRKR